MMGSFLTVVLWTLPLTSAYDLSQWSPPGPNDVRSPCPVLNSLANHDVLPHSGKGLTVPQLQDSLDAVLNIGKDLSTVLAVGGLLTSPNPLGLSFDLDNLNKHNDIEHDGSLGHNDFNLGGDVHTFNQTLFDTYLVFYNGMNETNIEQAAKGRMMRIKTEAQRDPQFTYGPKQVLISYAETALALSALGDPVDGKVPVGWLKILWEQERLPYAEGWRTPAQNINAVSVNIMIAKLMDSSGEALSEGLLITKNIIMRSLAGLDSSGLIEGVGKQLLDMFQVSL